MNDNISFSEERFLTSLSSATPLMAPESFPPIFIENPHDIPAEAVPENFVSYALKHQEELPPITWENWYKELHWLQIFVLVFPPILVIIGFCYTPILAKTFVWGVIYGHLTGMGAYITFVFVVSQC